MIFTNQFMDIGGFVYIHEKVDALPNEKGNAFLQFLSIICRSWTFGRMTERERENLVNSFLQSNEQGLIKGNYNARWNTMQAMYSAFLSALDYDRYPGDWRGDSMERR